MSLYEHTIIAKQDVSESQLKQLKSKYLGLIEKFNGNIVKTEDWGLLNLSYLIKKNKKADNKLFPKKWDIVKPPPRTKTEILHPAKFPETIEKAIKLKPNLPDDLINILDKPKYSLHGPNDYKTIMSLIEGNRRN